VVHFLSLDSIGMPHGICEFDANRCQTRGVKGDKVEHLESPEPELQGFEQRHNHHFQTRFEL